MQLASIFEMLLPNTGKDNTNPTLWYNAVVSVNLHNPVEHTHTCVYVQYVYVCIDWEPRTSVISI